LQAVFIDASAIVAILLEEDGWHDLAEKLMRTEKVHTSPVGIWESAIGIARTRDWRIEEAERFVRQFLAQVEAEVVPIDDEIGSAAILASRVYGKGRHPAKLNMGDCFTYACAKVLNVPLLCKGDDFALTDVDMA
jgi:ribonuclease VapC